MLAPRESRRKEPGEGAARSLFLCAVLIAVLLGGLAALLPLLQKESGPPRLTCCVNAKIASQGAWLFPKARPHAGSGAPSLGSSSPGV